jgi:hypothetical protein
MLSIVSIAFGFFAVYYDRSGIAYLENASTTQGYCEQLLAAGFVFDIVMIICSLALFGVSFLSLLCPGCFNEQTYESVLRQDRLKKQREERQQQQRQQQQDWQNEDVEQGHKHNINNNIDAEEEGEGDSKDYYSEKSADGQALYGAAYGGSSRKVYMPSRNGDFDDVTTNSSNNNK